MKGSYILVIELKKDKIIEIGKLGNISFKNGFYIYAGSALNGLDQRIQRHIRKQKKIFWHIDYLLKHAEIINVFYKESNVREECTIAKKLDVQLSSITGFGCSDCQCKSHLFYGSYREVISAIEKLDMEPYQKSHISGSTNLHNL